MLLDLEISWICSMEEIRNANKIVVDNLQGKETIYETCSKINIGKKKRGCKGIDWIQLA
jgi:hypothetical protein